MYEDKTYSEEDFFATSNGFKFSLGSEAYGHIGDFVEYDDVLEAMAEWANRENFFPSLYFVSDHGNIDDESTPYLYEA